MAENKSIFPAMQVQSCNTNGNLLSLKNLLVLANTKLHSKSCCYIYKKLYTKNLRASNLLKPSTFVM